MVDGRVYVSNDNWTTVYVITKPGARKRLVKDAEAHGVRLLVAYGAAASD